MNNYNHRIIKIVSELMSFCYRIHCKNFNVDVETLTDKTIINLEAQIENVPKETIINTERLLKVPRLHELEEYYWNLTGTNMINTELNLVGMMTDEAYVNYSENKYLTIKLIRIN